MTITDGTEWPTPLFIFKANTAEERCDAEINDEFLALEILIESEVDDAFFTTLGMILGPEDRATLRSPLSR